MGNFMAHGSYLNIYLLTKKEWKKWLNEVEGYSCIEAVFQWIKLSHCEYYKEGVEWYEEPNNMKNCHLMTPVLVFLALQSVFFFLEDNIIFFKSSVELLIRRIAIS